MSKDTSTKLQNTVSLQLGIEPSKVRQEVDFSKKICADSIE